MGMLGREIGHFLVGMTFLTRFPAPGVSRHEGDGLARSARYFPLIGALVGLVAGGVFALASMVLPALVAAGLALTAGLVATGALHEDGLADCCDALGGATREKALEIMRDSRIGTYGGLALIVSLGLRWMALAHLTAMAGLVALVVCHAVSRAMIPPVLASVPYARTSGLASSAAGASPADAGIAMALALVIAMLAGPVAGLAALAAAVVTGGVVLAIAMRRLGGYTGDVLGAIQQVAEIAALMMLVGIWT